MSKEMNWDTFVPTKEIREYDMKLRESIRQREQLKVGWQNWRNARKTYSGMWSMLCFLLA